MPHREPSRVAPGRAFFDVRLRGFPDRVSLDRAQACVDAHALRLASVDVHVGEAAGRILSSPLEAVADQPPSARVSEDGYAVRADDTVGASTYNPVVLRPRGPSDPPSAGAAALVVAGAPLPEGTDAVLGFDSAQATEAGVECIAAVASGAGVEPQGRQVRAGTSVAAAGRRLLPHEAAWLATVGVERVSVVARPRVRVVIAGAKGGGAVAPRDAHGPLLRALVERDGGAPEVREAGASLGHAIRLALEPPAPELVIVTGRTGTGQDDAAPLALAEVGELLLHGIALRPGGTAAVGLASGILVALLPGDPLGCLVSYELVAGRAVRGAAGLEPGLPHRRREAKLARKLASSVGLVEVCQVRLAAGAAEPLGIADFGGLSLAARADGFVVVPAALEGHPAGQTVTVHEY